MNESYSTRLWVCVENTRASVVRNEMRDRLGLLRKVDVLRVVVLAHDAVHPCDTY